MGQLLYKFYEKIYNSKVGFISKLIIKLYKNISFLFVSASYKINYFGDQKKIYVIVEKIFYFAE